MSIQNYFTEQATVKRKTRTKTGGVVKEELSVVADVRCAIDKNTTAYAFLSDKETFQFSDILFIPYGTDIVEDDIVTIDSKDYDVISVIDPMRRTHHLEVLINRRD